MQTLWTSSLGQVSRHRKTEQDSEDKKDGTGKLRQDCGNKTAGEDIRDSTFKIGKRGQDGQNMTARTKLGQDNREVWDNHSRQDRKDSTSGRDHQYMIAGTGHSGQLGLTGQTGQVYLDRNARTRQQRQDSCVRRAVNKVAGGRAVGTRRSGIGDSWDRDSQVRTIRKDNPDITNGTRNLGQDDWDRSAVTGRTGQVGLTGHPGQDRENRTARTCRCLESVNFPQNVYENENFFIHFREKMLF
jgi:hypothetical protein